MLLTLVGVVDPQILIFYRLGLFLWNLFFFLPYLKIITNNLQKLTYDAFCWWVSWPPDDNVLLVVYNFMKYFLFSFLVQNSYSKTYFENIRLTFFRNGELNVKFCQESISNSVISFFKRILEATWFFFYLYHSQTK